MVIGIFIGAFILILLELNKAITKENFSVLIFIKINLLPLILNISCGLAIIWMKEDISEFIHVTKVTSVILGLSGQSLFKKLMSVFTKGIDTKIGINKK